MTKIYYTEKKTILNIGTCVNKIKNASDEDLDEMIEEYFEYHDTKYGVDYNYNI
jgi:hypothetical protein